MYICGSAAVQCLATSPHSRKGPFLGQSLSVGSLYVLPVSAWVLSGFSGFLPRSKTMQTGVRLTHHSKLTLTH